MQIQFAPWIRRVFAIFAAALGHAIVLNAQTHSPPASTRAAAGNGQATTVSSLTVNAITPELSVLAVPLALQLSWPANSSNWLLQYQSNPPSAGLGTNWQYWKAPMTNPLTTPIYPGAGSIFYRLILTNW